MISINYNVSLKRKRTSMNSIVRIAQRQENVSLDIWHIFPQLKGWGMAAGRIFLVYRILLKLRPVIFILY